jgi:hypothetical protein
VGFVRGKPLKYSVRRKLDKSSPGGE